MTLSPHKHIFMDYTRQFQTNSIGTTTLRLKVFLDEKIISASIKHSIT